MSSPYELLTGLALLRERKRLADTSGEGRLESWSALLIKLGDTLCVLRQDDVEEILSVERLTRVYDVAPWLIGVGYFRGKLMNILDGRRLFQCATASERNNAASRVLVIKGSEEYYGLKVGELVGIRHVWSDNTVSYNTEKDENWLGLVEQWIKIEDNMLPVVQVRQLMQELERSGHPL